MIALNEKMKVLCFGELLLRIELQSNWIQSGNFPFYMGGAELNVACALALWEVPTAYFTALPNNPMSKELVISLNQRHIDTTRIHYSGERIGIYYLSQGKDLKDNDVIYDRSNSSFASLTPKNIDWEKIFEDISWFHFSAICPALNQNSANICLEALKFANKKNIFISLDLNYRSKLWKYGKIPLEIIPELANYCDLIMGNIWAANQMLGITVKDIFFQNITHSNMDLIEQAEHTSKSIVSNFKKCQLVANTFRFDNHDGIRYFSTLFSNEKLNISHTWEKETIKNKVGSGDCFMAGLIYGLYNQLSDVETLEYATAAAVDKLDIASDVTTSTVNQIKDKIKN